MEDNAELESFRRQWREEVARRSKQTHHQTSHPKPSASSIQARPSQFPPTLQETSERKEIEEVGTGALDQSEIVVQGVSQLSFGTADEDAFHSRGPREEPKSALEHFERAVEKEAEGNLGDSLQHYRKAYRLDATVDKTYRNKHFAWAWKKSAQASAPSNSGVLPSQQPKDTPKALPTPELIASFANLPIPQAEPIIENTPPPPCPIAKVPSEVLVEILKHVALRDPATFFRTSLVCKRLAYHFAHEQHIWKRLCQGPEFGFKSMHYSFACDVFGRPEYTLGPRYTPFPTSASVQIPEPLSSWGEVFQMFPRIRFTGIYISTVNYTRAGAASSYQSVSWNSPIHIVTYYRFLRFYPDGSVISMLSTVEPVDLVPHICKENVMAARATSQKQHQRQLSDGGTSLSGAPDPIPPVAMGALKQAQWGRWRMAHPSPHSGEPQDGRQTDPSLGFLSSSGKVSPDDTLDPRDIIIETEGVGSKYIYLLYLSLRSSTTTRSNSTDAPANPSKNTKLAWKGHWSYNKLTDDWAEFRLRNDRAFVFRRVRGWGIS
ncbi:hypothetical protein EYZ11_000830 [Aspergillus tanneri]|uniref:F-box domain-containing protein n=1 Tax=Aspergillus tanneri TaxID=1220188 RepID=A0A4S3JW30_9EURO|nr:uncharacterized protein ATNIH1004_003144 [Aspergillus tanneri]KAA8650458.1 hypothetical protein ATNIH1004_003144 [Aspergillus tanneri]THC99669.1 hypothetical protein EYZ11_000830 [Aspergillus tanneri]